MLLETSVKIVTCYENICDIGGVTGSTNNTEVYSPHLFFKDMLNFRKGLVKLKIQFFSSTFINTLNWIHGLSGVHGPLEE